MGCKGNAARNRVLIAATQGGAHYSTCNENKTREKSEDSPAIAPNGQSRLVRDSLELGQVWGNE